MVRVCASLPALFPQLGSCLFLLLLRLPALSALLQCRLVLAPSGSYLPASH